MRTFPGWGQRLAGAREREDLPAPARAFVAFLEAELGVPVTIISTGPEREALLVDTAGVGVG